MSYDREITIPGDFVQLASGAPSSGPYDCPDRTRGVLVGVAGTLDVVMLNGEARTGIPVPAGIMPGRFAQVTGGTAQNIWAIL